MAKTPPNDADDGAQDEALPPNRPHGLLPPSAQALRRAAPLFAQLMGLGAPEGAQARAPRPGDRSVAPPRAAVPPRAYPLAARLLGLAQAPVLEVGDAALPAAADVSAPVTQATAPAAGPVQLPRRPQGFVRKSVPKTQLVPQVLLEDVAQMALFDEGTGEQGGSFVIVFREELLGELQCRIEVGPTGEVAATFLAADGQTLALLRAHTARLEAQLAQQGLRHVTLAIEAG